VLIEGTYCPEALARIALCDLLIGRDLRLRAEKFFQQALLLDRMRLASAADECLSMAAHAEWIAVQAERGCIAWGGRFNRCGYQPREEIVQP
jgi:hypothetical protein